MIFLKVGMGLRSGCGQSREFFLQSPTGGSTISNPMEGLPDRDEAHGTDETYKDKPIYVYLNFMMPRIFLPIGSDASNTKERTRVSALRLLRLPQERNPVIWNHDLASQSFPGHESVLGDELERCAYAVRRRRTRSPTAAQSRLRTGLLLAGRSPAPPPGALSWRRRTRLYPGAPGHRGL